jgi:hypothetical protein
MRHRSAPMAKRLFRPKRTVGSPGLVRSESADPVCSHPPAAPGPGSALSWPGRWACTSATPPTRLGSPTNNTALTVERPAGDKSLPIFDSLTPGGEVAAPPSSASGLDFSLRA